MANQIPGDSFPTHQALTQRKSDAGPSDSRPPQTPDPAAQNETAADRAQLGRAQQRLSQETLAPGEPAITDAASARRGIAALKDLITAAPQAAVAAHGGMDGDVFAAAMARPTA